MDHDGDPRERRNRPRDLQNAERFREQGIFINDPMRFEFAKRLKAAGFPQDAVYGTLFFNGVGNLIFIDADLVGKTWVTYARCPTLPELIEACGDDFESLENNDGAWWACASRSFSIHGSPHATNCMVSDCPDEAMGKLWIALHSS